MIRAGKSMPVTATEVTVRFRPAPYDVFGAGRRTDHQRAAVPDLAGDRRSASRLAGKKPGAGRGRSCRSWRSPEQPGPDMRPYDRLIGAALDGNRCRSPGRTPSRPPGGSSTRCSATSVPVHPYRRGSWGPQEADALLPDRRHLARPGRLSGHPGRRSSARNIGSTRSVRTPLRPPRFAPGCPPEPPAVGGHRGAGSDPLWAVASSRRGGARRHLAEQTGPCQTDPLHRGRGSLAKTLPGEL